MNCSPKWTSRKNTGRKSRGTNPLERANREIKRRADVIGIFPNDDAIIRLVGALMLETNDEWTVARRYMSLETLARVTDTPTVRLHAVATRSGSDLSEGRRSETSRWDTIYRNGAHCPRPLLASTQY